MSLQDLVTSSLPETEQPREFEPLPPTEVNTAVRASYPDLLLLCKRFRETVPERPQEAPYLLAQLMAYFERGPIPVYSLSAIRKPTAIFAIASTYALHPDEDLLGSLLEWIEQTELEIRDYRFGAERGRVMPTTTARLDFLLDFFGSQNDLRDELVYLRDVQSATARRWIDGASTPSWNNAEAIKLLAHAFYAARHLQEMSDEEILEWYRKGRLGGQSPREMLQGCYGSYVSPELGREFRTVGFCA